MEQVSKAAGILAVLSFLAGTAWADGGTVSGVVRVGKDPAAFAENGHYLIRNVPSGRYAIEALLVGFETVTDSVTVREGGDGMVGGDFDRRRGEFVRWLKQAWPAEPPARGHPGPESR